MENKQYTKEEIKKLEDKKNDIERILAKYYLEDKFQQIEDHKKYVGKCYIDHDNKRYIKVISQYADYKDCVTVLCVNCNDQLLIYGIDFDGTCSRYPFISSDAELFCTDTIHMSNLLNMVEVSSEEFNQVMDNAYKQFKAEINEFADNIEKMVNQWR